MYDKEILSLTVRQWKCIILMNQYCDLKHDKWKVHIQGGEFKSIVVENWPFFANGSQYYKKFSQMF